MTTTSEDLPTAQYYSEGSTFSSQSDPVLTQNTATTNHQPLLFKKLIQKHWKLQALRRSEDVGDEFLQEGDLFEIEAYADYVIVFEYKTPSKRGVLGSINEIANVINSTKDGRAKKRERVTNDFVQIIKRLNSAGLITEVRTGVDKVENIFTANSQQPPYSNSQETDDATEPTQATKIVQIPNMLLIFVTCSEERLDIEIKKQNMFSLHTETEKYFATNPSRRSSRNSMSIFDLTPKQESIKIKLTESARQALVYQIISGPIEEGCANVSTNNETLVKAIFPIHDSEYNKEWLKNWSTKWLIDQSDLQDLRNHFGEQVSMYFAFLQYYILWLSIPAFLGIFFYLFNSSFSLFLALFVLIWGVSFTETWDRRQNDLATFWGVQGSSAEKEPRRSQFKPETYQADEATGEIVPTFPHWKRWCRRAVGIPVILACLLFMLALVSAIFALQVFMEEKYDGPLSDILVLVPTILYSACMPTFTTFCQSIASKLTDYENYERQSEYIDEYSRKIFLFRFLQDQSYLLLMAWVFIPLREYFETFSRAPWLWFIGLFFSSTDDQRSSLFNLKESTTPAAEKLQSLLIYFVVTAQIINQFTESFLPVMIRYFNEGKFKSILKSKKGSHTDISTNSATDDSNSHETREKTQSGLESSEIEEAKFICKITKEAKLPSYVMFDDYAEMATQFGYVTFYSIAWPLAPLIAFINNLVELRSDAAKICLAVRKPIPVHANSIGPWQSALVLTSWLGSIASALLVYQFNSSSWLFGKTDPSEFRKFGRTSWVNALITTIFAEHLYLASTQVVDAILKAWPTAAEKKLLDAKRNMRMTLIEKISKEGSDIFKPQKISLSLLDHSTYQKTDLNYGVQIIQSAFKEE